MNGKEATTLGIYILGAVLGGFVGKLVADQVVENMTGEDEVDGEWATLTDAELAKVDAQVAPYKTAAVAGPELIMIKDKKEKLAKKKVVDYGKYANKTPLSELTKNYIDDAQEPTPDVDPTLPHIITLDDFCEVNGNVKESVMYYEGDETVAGEDDGIMPTPESFLGDDALINFGKGSDDPDVVYVRNNKIGVDYEITRVKGTYQELVMGIKPEEEKKPKRKRRTNKSISDAESED